MVQEIRDNIRILDFLKIPKGTKARETQIKNTHKEAFNKMKIKSLEKASEKNPDSKEKNDQIIKKIKKKIKFLEKKDFHNKMRFLKISKKD